MQIIYGCKSSWDQKTRTCNNIFFKTREGFYSKTYDNRINPQDCKIATSVVQQTIVWKGENKWTVCFHKLIAFCWL